MEEFGDKSEGLLSLYRVLDLSDEKGLLCGKILGDLGADVIKIEKPGGDSARNLGPFYHDEPEPEKSLFWFAYNTNKRGVSLDIETTDGQEIFKMLVKKADIVIESFQPKYMDKLGLGYKSLKKANPRIIMISITSFGQSGPYKDYKAPDIVAWALGGYMYSVGYADRPPVRIGYHSQAYLQAGGQAAQAAVMALYHREITGKGQYVDVSVHDSVTRCSPEGVTYFWDYSKRAGVRQGRFRGGEPPRLLRVWPCKDGYVCAFYWSGQSANRRNLPFVRWMESEGVASDIIKGIDWDNIDLQTADQEIIDSITESTYKLFMSHTKAELLEGALKHNAQLYPVASVADILDNPQLTDREFWVELEHPELGDTITYPGAFAKTSEAPPRISRRAPLIGEHNQEIYEKELGISHEELLILKQAKVI